MKTATKGIPWKNKPREPEPGMRLAPPDGGWGWILVAASSLNALCFVTILTTYAVLFSAHIQEMGGSKTSYAIITNLNFSVWSVLALIIGPLCDIYGHKRVTMAGAILSFITLVTCAFAPNVGLFATAYGVIGGMAGALCLFPGAVLIPRYFDRRKGLANGIITGVLSLGKSAMPIIGQFLLDYYGYRWTCLILAVWCLNAIPVAMTQHPPHWHQMQVPIDAKPEDINNLPSKIELRDSGIIETSTKVKEIQSLDQYQETKEEEVVFQRSPEITRQQSKESVLFINSSDKKSLVKHIKDEEGRGVSRTRSRTIGSSTLSLAASINDLVNIPLEDDDGHGKSKQVSKWDKFVVFRVFRMMEYSLLLNPLFYMISLPQTITLLVYINYLYLVPDHLEDIGVSSYMRALMLSVPAISECVFRFLFAWLSDFKWLPIRWVYIATACIISIALISIPLYRSFNWVLGLCMIYAGGRAVLSVLQIHVSLHYIDKSLYPQVIGFSSIMNFFGYTIGGFAIGGLRTAIGSSAVTIQVIGCLGFSSVIIWLMEPLIKRYKEALDLRKQRSSNNR